MIYLGIDLGTTFSIVSYVNPQGVPTLFPDYHDANEFRTPSVVHIGPEGCFVGQALEELLEDEPALPCARFVKLAMGMPEAVFTDHQERLWLPEGISAVILRKMLHDVQAFVHEDVGGVIITVPANFNDEQRRATRNAALLAGLPCPQLIEEPVAAATYYGFAEGKKEQTLFVYDLGGGTFDATVLQSSPEGLYALATEGNNRLGGKEVDEVIMKQVTDEFLRQHGFNPLDDPASATQLRRFATDTKLKLARPGREQVRKTLLLAGRTLDFIITRNQFERMIEDLIDETLVVSERCLKSAGLDWSLMDRILLTGGSSLLPLVEKKIALASQKSRTEIVCKQPHQAVAYGAALIAEQRRRQLAGEECDTQLQQISAYDLGIRVADKQTGQPAVEVLIPRNSPIPARQGTTFYTTRADQTRMVIEVVQQRAPGVEEKSLGYFAFGPIDKPRKNYPVEITLAYDLDGLVTVTARDPDSGQEIEQILDQEGEHFNARMAEQKEWVTGLEINR